MVSSPRTSERFPGALLKKAPGPCSLGQRRHHLYRNQAKINCLVSRAPRASLLTRRFCVCSLAMIPTLSNSRKKPCSSARYRARLSTTAAACSGMMCTASTLFSKPFAGTRAARSGSSTAGGFSQLPSYSESGCVDAHG